jgi:L-aspartate oxidase
VYLTKNQYDVLVIGSGIAGLYAALKAAEFSRVCLLTKGELHQTNTWLAQGGIAAAFGEDDSPEQHLADTLEAGAGICDRDAVAIMAEEGPLHVAELIQLGTPFDSSRGKIALTREGAHRRNRVLHCGGDATGRMIQETLQQRVIDHEAITVCENIFVTDLVSSQGIVSGVKTLSGEIYRAGSVILATGGLGQVFSRTTNPVCATADGVAMAYRAGAEIADMEFVQFHPTVFYDHRSEETFLISEAVRGEGAVLRNAKGERFMDSYHEMAELGPRDVVARAILDQMLREESNQVCLDITHRDKSFLVKRFPTICKMAEQAGYDLSCDFLPVSPAAHYAMGGIKAGVNGETNLPGLYACGEVACSGVHGANRLASNSLLEGLVFAARAVKYIEKKGKTLPAKMNNQAYEQAALPLVQGVGTLRSELQRRMFEQAGVLRDGSNLKELWHFFEKNARLLNLKAVNRQEWELQNLFTAASLIVRAAMHRTESRGGHFRLDYPASDSAWMHRLSWSNKQKGDYSREYIAV